MNRPPDMNDTIAAVATAPGAAGLAVIRVSGGEAFAVADRVFRGVRPLALAPSHTLHHGWAVDGLGERIDEVVAALFRAPRSYTREDVVELSCHGGRLPADGVLRALLAAGARLAGPGEFSLRAFLSGRIDLAQAEAVADLIAAETRAARTLALSQLAGEWSARLRAISASLLDALAEVEARVDFAEDVGGVEIPPHVAEAVARALTALDHVLRHAGYARAIRDGARVPIVGRPNAGKSSLFNALLGEERALVAAVPGTTRDRVSESVELDGVRVVLSDTAGIRDDAGAVEAMGIARTEALLAESPVALWVVDASAPLEADDARIADLLAGKRAVVALNKVDAGERVGPADVGAFAADAACVRVSALERRGIDTLRSALLDALGGDRSREALGLAASNPRHVEALGRARAALARAAALASAAAPGELMSIELRDAANAVGEVTGETVAEALLDRIFSRFCVGK